MAKENKTNNGESELINNDVGKNIIQTSQRKNFKQLIIILAAFVVLFSFVITFVVIFNQNKKSVIANQLETPQNVAIEQKMGEDGKTQYDLIFDKVTHADYYAIYLFEGKTELEEAANSNFLTAIPYKTTTRTRIDVTDTIDDIGEYFYSVQAIYRKVESYSSLLSDPTLAVVTKEYNLNTPVVSVEISRDNTNIFWRSVANASKYKVYYNIDIRYKETNESVLNEIKTINGNSYALTENEQNILNSYPKNEFIVKVRSQSDKQFVLTSDWGEAELKTYKTCETPVISSHSFVNEKYAFSWNKCEYAQGYYVYINGKVAAAIQDANQTSYEFIPEELGNYYVQVSAFNNDKYIDDSNKSEIVNLETFRRTTQNVENLTADRVNEEIRVSWNAVGDRTYYYVFIQNEQKDEFEDLNGNGIFDDGETLLLDRNHNGTYDDGVLLTKPGSTESYYEKLDSQTSVSFPLTLNPTGYYKIGVMAVRQGEFFDESEIVKTIIRFDETNKTKLATPSLLFEETTKNLVYGPKGQTEQSPELEDGVSVKYMAPMANDNNGFELKIYAGLNSEGTVLEQKTFPKVSLELSSYKYSISEFLNTFGAGKYYATIKALGGYLLFDSSDEKGVIIDYVIKLATPSGLSVNNDGDDVVLNFDKVLNAKNYQVSVGDDVIYVDYNANMGTYSAYTKTSSGAVKDEFNATETGGIIIVTNLKTYFAPLEPQTYNFSVKAVGDNVLYTDSDVSEKVTYKLVKYVNTPILSHVSQRDANNEMTNDYYVYWEYRKSNLDMFDKNQTFDIFVNGVRAVSGIKEGDSLLEIKEESRKFYRYNIAEYALPGRNVVQIRANAINNYLPSMSEQRIFEDHDQDGDFIQESYYYYIGKQYDIGQKISVSGMKVENSISYNIRFMSEKYANSFKFWVDPTQDIYENVINDANTAVYKSFNNVYLNGYVNKETKIAVPEEYIAKNGITNIHFEISFDITQENRNLNITAERAKYIVGIWTKGADLNTDEKRLQNVSFIAYSDPFHLSTVADFDYDVFSEILNFKYRVDQIKTVQTFVISYKFGDDGDVLSVVLNKDDCMAQYKKDSITTVLIDGQNVDCYEFEYLFRPNTVGKLCLRVIPTNAGSVLNGELVEKYYYTSKTLDAPQEILINDGIVSWNDVENAAGTNESIEPYHVMVYVDADINDENAAVYDEFDWGGISFNLFSRYSSLQSAKHNIFVKVFANGHQFALFEGTFNDRSEYVGYYTKDGNNYLIITDPTTVELNVTPAYYPQYKKSATSTSGVFEYTPTLMAPKVLIQGDRLTIQKTQHDFIPTLSYALYYETRDGEGNVLEADLLKEFAPDSTNEIVVNIGNLIKTEKGLGAGRYYLYAISKHEAWQVSSPQSVQMVYYDVIVDLNSVQILLSSGTETLSYATKRQATITFKNTNDLNVVDGFMIYFNNISDSSAKILGNTICVVKNEDGSFSGQITNGTYWENKTDITASNVSVIITYNEVTQTFSVTYFVEGSNPSEDIFEGASKVIVEAVGDDFHRNATSSAVIRYFDGQFKKPIIYVQSETNFYMQADKNTNNAQILIGKQDGAQTANIYFKNILDKEANNNDATSSDFGYYYVLSGFNLQANEQDGFYVLNFNPYAIFGDKIGIYEIVVEFNNSGFIQKSLKSNFVYIYYSFMGEGISSVLAEPNLSNLPLNLKIEVNNSIYSNVDKSTFESFSVVISPSDIDTFVVDGVTKVRDENNNVVNLSEVEAKITTLVLNENISSSTSAKGNFQEKLFTSKTVKETTTLYEFAIPISYIDGFAQSWKQLNWNYKIGVAINYTTATNLNNIINDVTPVYSVLKTEKTKFSQYALDINRVVGKYYFDKTANEYILIQAGNIKTNSNETVVEIDLSDDTASSNPVTHTLTNDDYVYDVSFEPYYATYVSASDNTYVGGYYNEESSYKKIYGVQRVQESNGAITGLKVFGRTGNELGTIKMLGQVGQTMLDWDEFAFTTSSKVVSGSLSTSGKTSKIQSENIMLEDGRVSWGKADTSTTFYYMFYSWDIAQNKTKLFYNDDQRQNFFELTTPSVEFNDETRILSYNFNSASVENNHLFLAKRGSTENTLAYRKLQFNGETQIKEILSDLQTGERIYFYRTNEGNMIRLTQTNVFLKNEEEELIEITSIDLTGTLPTGTFVLENAGNEIILTDSVLYEESYFLDFYSRTGAGQTYNTIDEMDCYYLLGTNLIKITEANIVLYDNVYYLKTNELGLNGDNSFANISEQNGNWTQKWFSVIGNGINQSTYFDIDSYNKNYAYGVLIYAKKAGLAASSVVNKVFVPQFAYNLVGAKITSQKSGAYVDYTLTFNEFNTEDFSYENMGNTYQAIINQNIRQKLYDYIKVGNTTYHNDEITSIEDGFVNISLSDGNIVNSLDPYAVEIVTKDLIFEINGAQSVVIPKVSKIFNVNAPVVVNEEVSIKFKEQFILQTGTVESTLFVKPVNFATKYVVVITKQSETPSGEQSAEKTYFQNFEVIGTQELMLKDLTTISGTKDGQVVTEEVLEYNISEFMAQITPKLMASSYYKIWVYVPQDLDNYVDSTETVNIGGITDTDFFDATFKKSQDLFIAYKKAETPQNLAMNLTSEDGKSLQFETEENEFENSVYRIEITNGEQNVMFGDNHDKKYVYYWKSISGVPISSASFDDGELKEFTASSYTKNGTTYSITLDITNEMNNALAGQYAFMVTVIPVVNDSHLTTSDEARSMAYKNNRRLQLLNNDYLTVLVDGFISAIENGEPQYFDEMVFDENIYNDLNSNNKYYYKLIDDYVLLSRQNVTIENGTYYYRVGDNKYDITNKTVYKERLTATSYINNTQNIFNDKKIIENVAFNPRNESMLKNWVDGLVSGNGNITITLEVAFKQGGNFVAVNGQNWNNLKDLVSLGNRVSKDLPAGEYDIYVRAVTTNDMGQYFESTQDGEKYVASQAESGSTQIDGIKIISGFNIYQRHMVAGSTIIEAFDYENKQYKDVLMTTGIDEAGAEFEVYCYDKDKNLVFRMANFNEGGVSYIRSYNKNGQVVWTSDENRRLRQTAPNEEFSIFEFMLANNEVLTYGKYYFKVKWISNSTDLSDNILNSDLNETDFVEFNFYVDATISSYLTSNKEIIKKNGQYVFKSFEGAEQDEYVLSYNFNTVLTKPQINATLFYKIQANNRIFNAYVKTTINGFAYDSENNKWIITYEYSLVDKQTSNGFSIDDGVLIYDMQSYVFSAANIVGEYLFRSTIQEVKQGDTNIAKSIISAEDISAVYEDIYATYKDKWTEDDAVNEVTTFNGNTYHNLILQNLTLSDEGMLTWDFSDNLRLNMVGFVYVELKDNVGNQIFAVKLSPTNTSVDLKNILLSDKSTSYNYNNLYIYLVLKDTNVYWKLPSPLTNDNIAISNGGVLSDESFVWEPNILDGSALGGPSGNNTPVWTNENSSTPNVIEFTLDFNDYYAKDTRIQGANTPKFKFEILKVDYSKYIDYGFSNLADQSIPSIISAIEGIEVNRPEYTHVTYGESDWAHARKLQNFVLALNDHVVDFDNHTYRFGLKDLLKFVDHKKLTNEEKMAVTSGSFEQKYYILQDGEYALIRTFEEFSSQASNDIFVETNNWVKDNALIPGQYFIKISLFDSTENYKEGVILEGKSHVLESWLVEDLKLVTEDFSVNVRQPGSPVQAESFAIKTIEGKANANLILYENIDSVTDEQKVNWAQNTNKTYITFKVKNTGASLPHEKASMNIIHYYASEVNGGAIYWSSDEISNGSRLTVSASDYLGIDENNFHVYVVDISNFVSSLYKEQFGLHKFRVVVSGLNGQAYASDENTLAMSNEKAYVNYVQVDMPELTFVPVRDDNGSSGDRSGKLTIIATYKFHNYLADESKTMIVKLRVYENPRASNLNSLPYLQYVNTITTSLSYSSGWPQIDLSQDITEAAIQSIRKNVVLYYETFVDVNGFSPFVINSEKNVVSHILIEGYLAPKELSVVRNETNSQYENFVVETDDYYDIKDSRDYYNLNLKIGAGDAARSVTETISYIDKKNLDGLNLLDSSVYETAYSENDIKDMEAWKYYNLDGVTESNKNNFKFFVFKLTTTLNQEAKNNHYFVAWYEEDKDENGVPLDSQTKDVKIKQIEIMPFVDLRNKDVFVICLKNSYKPTGTYYQKVGEEYRQITVEEAFMLDEQEDGVVYELADNLRTKYMLKEYIALENELREIAGKVGAEQYENRYIIWEGNFVSAYDQYSSLEIVDGKIAKQTTIYAKQSNISGGVQNGIFHTTFTESGAYTSSYDGAKGSYEKNVTLNNFGLPLRIILEGNDDNGLLFNKPIAGIGFKAQLIKETSELTTNNSGGKNFDAINHFVKVCTPEIENIEFTNLIEEDGVIYIDSSNEGNVELIITLSNIFKSKLINFVYEVSRGETGTIYSRNMFKFALPESGTIETNGIRIEKVNNQYVITLTNTGKESVLGEIINNLPGEIKFYIQAVGDLNLNENTNNNYYDYYDTEFKYVPDINKKSLPVFTVIKSTQNGINGYGSGAYLNSQDLVSYVDSNQKTILKKLNAIEKNYLQLGYTQTDSENNKSLAPLFVDNQPTGDEKRSYLGTNLIKVDEDGQYYNISKDFMLYLNMARDNVGYLAGSGLEDYVVDIMATFKIENQGNGITQNYMTGNSNKGGYANITVVQTDNSTDNKNLFDLFKGSIKKDNMVYLSLVVSYSGKDNGYENYWIASETTQFAFHFYNGVEVEKLTLSDMEYSATDEIEVNVSSENNNYIAKSGYMKPTNLMLSWDDVKIGDDNIIKGYNISIESSVYGKQNITIEKDGTACDLIENLNFDFGNAPKNLQDKRTFIKGSEWKIYVTPYYTSLDGYNIYGNKIPWRGLKESDGENGAEQSSAVNYVVKGKLSNLRDISVEYFYENFDNNGFLTNWNNCININDVSNASLLEKAKTQPTFNTLFMGNVSISSAIGTFGLRGLSFDNDFDKLVDYYLRKQQALTLQVENDKNNYQPLCSNASTNEWEIYVYQKYYENNEEKYKEITTIKNTDINGLTSGTNYFYESSIISALNQAMVSYPGGTYYIAYQIFDGQNEIGSGLSTISTFIYRKVYSDIDDFQIVQDTHTDSVTVNLNNEFSNDNGTNVATYYKNYNINEKLTIHANLLQKPVNNASDKNDLKVGGFKINTLSNTYSLNPSSEDGWTYKNDTQNVFSLDPSRLDALTFMETAYATPQLAQALQKYGYLYAKNGVENYGSYNNFNEVHEYGDGKGYLQIGQNLIQICVDTSDDFNLGFKFIYNFRGLDGFGVENEQKANGFKVDLPENFRLGFNRVTVGQSGTWAYIDPNKWSVTQRQFSTLSSNTTNPYLIAYANILVQYKFFIHNISYTLNNRNNYVASFKDDNDYNYVFNDGTDRQGNGISLSIKDYVSNPTKKSSFKAHLTLTPMFGGSYNDYGIIAQTFDNDLTVAESISLGESNPYKYDNDDSYRGILTEQNEVISVKQNTNYLYNQILMAQYEVTTGHSSGREFDWGYKFRLHANLKVERTDSNTQYEPTDITVKAEYEGTYHAEMLGYKTGWMGVKYPWWVNYDARTSGTLVVNKSKMSNSDTFETTEGVPTQWVVTSESSHSSAKVTEFTVNMPHYEESIQNEYLPDDTLNAWLQSAA